MLGKVEDVKKYLPRATSLIRRDKNLVWVIPSLIESAVKIGDLDYAKKLAEEFESRIYERTEELTLLKYFIATSAFIEEHYDRALTGAAYFDERNENSYYQDYLARYLGVEKRTKKFFN